MDTVTILVAKIMIETLFTYLSSEWAQLAG